MHLTKRSMSLDTRRNNTIRTARASAVRAVHSRCRSRVSCLGRSGHTLLEEPCYEPDSRNDRNGKPRQECFDHSKGVRSKVLQGLGIPEPHEAWRQDSYRRAPTRRKEPMTRWELCVGRSGRVLIEVVHETREVATTAFLFGVGLSQDTTLNPISHALGRRAQAPRTNGWTSGGAATVPIVNTFPSFPKSSRLPRLRHSKRRDRYAGATEGQSS